MDKRRCWYREDSGGQPHPVGEHEGLPNRLGLVDAQGNVGELCQDPYDRTEVHDHEGGSFRKDALGRVATLWDTIHGDHTARDDVGFRVARRLF